MKRRALLGSLFGIGATVAICDPAQARRFRGRRGLRRGRIWGRSRRVQPVSYSAPPRAQRAKSQVAQSLPTKQTKPQKGGIDRRLPEFWKSPGEIDRPIVAAMKPTDIQGKNRRELFKQYGTPMRDEGSQLVYNVGRTSDGIIAPETFTINLDSYGKATSFRRGF